MAKRKPPRAAAGSARSAALRARRNGHVPPPGRVVLVLQGGGALGAYQVGVYRALHEAGIDPEWVIGTSIGAINGAIIAGNPPERRMERLASFWDALEWRSPLGGAGLPPDLVNPFANVATFAEGVRGFFAPNPPSWMGLHAPLGVERAAFYDTAPLRGTLAGLVDFDRLAAGKVRLTVGAVNARTGAMRYFDSRDERLGPEHVMASGALPPAFPAVRIDGEPYWDGGIYSNTPIEAVLDDNPRLSSTIFTVQLWNPTGEEPESIWQVLGRDKEIRYASRAASHIAKQRQIHRLRHVISELARRMPAARREDAEVRELAAWGCRTTMHVVRLLAPRLKSEDHLKDIDFTPDGIRARREAGYRDALDVIAQAPWAAPADPLEGVVVHEHPSAMAGTMP